MSSDEDRWIERTGSDQEFADAVWSGTAPSDDAPSWYPRFAGMLDAAATSRLADDIDVAQPEQAWAEVQRRAVRRRRRRMLVAGAVALGAALAAGGAAAATDGGLTSLPFLGWESGADDWPLRGDRRLASDGARVVASRLPASESSGQDKGATEPQPAPAGGSIPPSQSCQPEAGPAPGCSDRGRQQGRGPSASPPPQSSAAAPPVPRPSDPPTGVGDRPSAPADDHPGKSGL